jgi:TetR/AcrR family transcriptional regulator, transcriptional repressor for nem operon
MGLSVWNYPYEAVSEENAVGRVMKFDRDEAVSTAMMEFWAHGVSNFTVKAFCEKVGITRSSFYHSFGTLESLFDESLECYLQNAPADCLESSIKSIYAMFRVLCRYRAKDKDHKGCLVVNSLSELNSLEEGIQESILNKLAETQTAFKKTLQQAVSNGELPHDYDIKTASLSLQTLMLGLNTVSKIVHKEKELWAIAESTLLGLGLGLNKK